MSPSEPQFPHQEVQGLISLSAGAPLSPDVLSSSHPLRPCTLHEHPTKVTASPQNDVYPHAHAQFGSQPGFMELAHSWIPSREPLLWDSPSPYKVYVSFCLKYLEDGQLGNPSGSLQSPLWLEAKGLFGLFRLDHPFDHLWQPRGQAILVFVGHWKTET